MLATLDTSRFVDFLKRLCSRSPALLQYAIYHQMYLSSRNITREGADYLRNTYSNEYALIWNNNSDKKETNKRIGKNFENCLFFSSKLYLPHVWRDLISRETGRDPTGICKEAIRGEWRE